MSRRARIAYRSRRGMRELDILLARFLEAGFDELPQTGKDAYERLLAENDHDLLAWLTGKGDPPDPDLADIARAIRRVNDL